MTSRVLFSKLFKNEIKRRIWILVVALLVMLLAGPVALLLTYENYSTYMTAAELGRVMIQQLSPSLGLDAIVTSGLAVLLALTGFSYLFSKKKVDLYHSIPVKREKIFVVSYLCGIFIYFSAYLIQIITVIMSAMGKGFYTGEAGMIYLHTIVGNLIHFLLIYNITIIAVMLTGNLVVSIAASGVLLSYGMIVSQVLWLLSSTYFLTYCTYPFSDGAVWRRVPFISPIASYVYFVNSCKEMSDVTQSQQVGHLVITLILAAVLFFVAVLLYKKRPSEAAGKALAFKKTEMIIRILIVIPVAIIGGELIVSINNQPKSGWFWFGLVLAGILCHCLMEIIYRFDFKAFANHKIQLVICLAAAAFIGLIYRQDLLGYDTYLPKPEQIKSASVVFTNVDNEMQGFELTRVSIDGTVYGSYTDRYPKQLNKVSLRDTNSVYELGRIGVGELDVMRDELQEDALLCYTIRYTLNSGRSTFRSYRVRVESAEAAFAKVYESRAYKKGAYDILPMIENHAFSKVEVYDIWGNKQLSLKDKEMEQFFNVYQSDLMNLSAKTLETEVPIARLSPSFRNGTYEDALSGYYIYPSFTATTDMMKKLGVYVGDMTTAINPDELESIKINDCGYLNAELGMSDYYSNGTLYVSSNKEDKAVIEELCKNLVNSNYTWSNITLCPFDQRIEFELLYKTKDGIQKTGYAYMKKEQIPQSVIDALVENAEIY